MIIVTGATGFIGRRFIQHLARFKKKEKILCLTYEKCDSELEKTGRTIIENLGIRSLPVNLITGAGLDKVPKSPSLVFHLASITDTSEPDHSINTVGTKNLLDAIGPLSKGAHVIFTSTIALNDTRTDYSIPINDLSETPERPCNEYGRSKLIAEKYLKERARALDFSLSIIRVCGVYGEGTRKNGLFDVIHEMAQKQSPLLRLDWPGKISLMHVDDMAKLIYEVSNYPPGAGKHEMYISSVEALTLAEMSRIAHDALGIRYREIKLPRFFWSLCSYLAKRKGFFERLMPHKLYNRFWQASLLVNNEFWNDPEKIYKVMPGWKPVRFKDYYNKVAAHK